MADPMQRVRYWLGGLLPGAAARRVQVAEYAEEWRRRNEAALSVDGPLWIVLGDSSAQAVGATSIDRGYVRGVLDLLRAQRDSAWRVVNLSRTGARAHHVVADQLPEMEALGPAALVSCAVGGNDLLRGSLDDSRRAFARIAALMPRGALLATMPRGVREGRAIALNEVVWSEAATHGHRVIDLWAHTGPPWEGKFSADHFHPNDTGYTDWVAAFAEAMELRGPGSPPPGP